jgi:hypothetical protein
VSAARTAPRAPQLLRSARLPLAVRIRFVFKSTRDYAGSLGQRKNADVKAHVTTKTPFSISEK